MKLIFTADIFAEMKYLIIKNLNDGNIYNNKYILKGAPVSFFLTSHFFIFIPPYNIPRYANVIYILGIGTLALVNKVKKIIIIIRYRKFNSFRSIF